MALHEQSVGATDEWYTPPRVFDALGCSFDLDVASPGQEVTPGIPAHSFPHVPGPNRAMDRVCLDESSLRPAQWHRAVAR